MLFGFEFLVLEAVEFGISLVMCLGVELPGGEFCHAKNNCCFG